MRHHYMRPIDVESRHTYSCYRYFTLLDSDLLAELVGILMNSMNRIY